jgi:hypothetical protein
MDTVTACRSVTVPGQAHPRVVTQQLRVPRTITVLPGETVTLTPAMERMPQNRGLLRQRLLVPEASVGARRRAKPRRRPPAAPSKAAARTSTLQAAPSKPPKRTKRKQVEPTETDA